MLDIGKRIDYNKDIYVGYTGLGDSGSLSIGIYLAKGSPLFLNVYIPTLPKGLINLQAETFYFWQEVKFMSKHYE